MDESRTSRIYRFGLFELNTRTGELRRKGSRVRIQELPQRVLLILLEHAGELVTREELHSRLWPADTFVDFDTGLNTAIRKLRDALGDTAKNSKWVETVSRRGYRFIADVALYEIGGTQPPLLFPAGQWLDAMTESQTAGGQDKIGKKFSK